MLNCPDESVIDRRSRSAEAGSIVLDLIERGVLAAGNRDGIGIPSSGLTELGLQPAVRVTHAGCFSASVEISLCAEKLVQLHEAGVGRDDDKSRWSVADLANWAESFD